MAAEIVGPQAMADTLAATLSTLSLEPIWHVSAHKRDARGALTKLVRANRRLAATKGSGDEPDSDRLPATDGAMSDETRSAVTARIVLLGSTPAAYEPPQQAALDALAGEDAVPMLTRILAPAGPAARWVEGEQFNPPRLTPGLVGWVLSGLTLFPVLFFVWLPQFHRHFVENLIFVVALFALWVWFLPTYLLLQREFDLSADGVRARAWLWAIRDGRRHGRNCHLLHWDGPLRVSISALQIMRLTDGRESVRASIEMWRRREVYSFFDAVRSRGGSVRFSRFSGGTDDERQIVIWLAGDSFILPDVRRAPDGRLLEFEPIRQIPIDVFRLADELRKRLSSRVKVVGSGRTLATEGRLAAAAAVEPGAFSDNARRITIEGFRSGVTIRVGDDPGRFVAGSSPHPAVVSMGVFLALGLVGSEADDDDVDDQRDPN
ncbi:MAG: hypothetical protein ACRDF7_06980 [Candidatus Limnocylindrales bacterium]